MIQLQLQLDACVCESFGGNLELSHSLPLAVKLNNFYVFLTFKHWDPFALSCSLGEIEKRSGLLCAFFFFILRNVRSSRDVERELFNIKKRISTFYRDEKASQWRQFTDDDEDRKKIQIFFEPFPRPQFFLLLLIRLHYNSIDWLLSHSHRLIAGCESNEERKKKGTKSLKHTNERDAEGMLIFCVLKIN